MTKEQIFESLQKIDEDILECSEISVHSRPHPAWKRWAATSACFGLFLGAAFLISNLPANESSQDTDSCPWVWDVYYNEVATMADAAKRYIPGYFEEALSPEEITAIEPGKRMEWMNYSGMAGFDGNGNLLRIYLSVTTTLPDTMVSVTISEKPDSPDHILPAEPVASPHGDVVYMVYQYTSGSDTQLEAEAKINDIYFSFFMNTATDALETAKNDFEEILDCFTYYTEDMPKLDAIVPEAISEWKNEILTMDEAIKDPDFGAYMLSELPDGFSEESIRRYMDQNSNFLSGLWTRGYDSLQWTVSYLNDSAAARITSAAEKENYDLSLYPIPRADSVPDELREIVDNPVFKIQELTLETVCARAWQVEETGDSNGYRMEFGALYGDVLVEIRTKGVSPEWVYKQLELLAGAEQ